MYKTAITLPEKIRSKSGSALLAGLVALTTLSITSLTASAGTTHGAGVTVGEIRDVVAKYLTEHPELLRQAAPAGECDHEVRLTLFEHLLVADRTGGTLCFAQSQGNARWG